MRTPNALVAVRLLAQARRMSRRTGIPTKDCIDAIVQARIARVRADILREQAIHAQMIVSSLTAERITGGNLN